MMAFDLLIGPFLDLFGKSEKDLTLLASLLIFEFILVHFEVLNVEFVLFVGPPVFIDFLS